MNTQDPAHALLRTRLVWLAAFIGASLIFTLALGCEVPLIAFAAICGLRQARREALLFVASIWLVDELVGFTAWHYPLTLTGFGWAGAVGAAILAATWAVGIAARRTTGMAGTVTSFFGAFAVYEALLWAVSTAAGTMTAESFSAAVLGQVLALNAATFAGLLLVRALKPRTASCARPLHETRLEHHA